MTDQASQVPAPQQPQAANVPDDRPNMGVLPQAIPTAVAQTPDPLNPAHPRPAAKETAPVMNIEPSADVPAGVQSVESLRTPEIPLEVEKYIEEVKDHPDQIPEEIVMNGQNVTSAQTPPLAKPVIVLPMTKDEFGQAKKASVNTSKRWLGEWVDKVIKMFKGEVVFSDKQQP